MQKKKKQENMIRNKKNQSTKTDLHRIDNGINRQGY